MPAEASVYVARNSFNDTKQGAFKWFEISVIQAETSPLIFFFLLALQPIVGLYFSAL